MPTMVNIHAAKTHFSRLVERAAQGEVIIIARAGNPLAWDQTSTRRSPRTSSVCSKAAECGCCSTRTSSCRLLDEEGRLPAAAREAIRAEDSAIFVSVAALWATAIKASLGRLNSPADAALRAYDVPVVG